jgi:hypothetical protein
MANSTRLTYAERVAVKRARRINPSPQALATRRRTALRNHEAAGLRDAMLSTQAAAGDAMATHLLAVSHG